MIEDLDALMEEAGVDAIIAQGNAFEVPDIFWLTGFRSTDEITVLKNRGEEQIIASWFKTIGRVKEESFVTRIHDMTELGITMTEQNKRFIDHPDIVFKDILQNLFTGSVLGVPTHLPANILVAIQSLGYEIKVVPHLLKSARATKSNREIKLIQKAANATMGAQEAIIEMIRNAEIGANKVLMHEGQPLTVKHIKRALDLSLLDQLAESAEDAIIAVGKRAFDWHYLGDPADKLKAGVPIIMDVFPRLKLDRYVADVTRTVVRGIPSKKVQHMFNSVKAAADAVKDALTAGAKIDDVNMACYRSLELNGYDSTKLNPHAQEGMTHGLGHGIGLEVHENPSLYRYDDHFETNHVVAIEPGVYLRSIGGVRLENDYLVTDRKAKRLTKGLDEETFYL